MEYEIFKGVVEEKFKEFLPEKYQNAQVEIRPVDKVNLTLDGLSIRVNEPGMNISPTIYVNHMYEDYVTTENLNAMLERAAEGFMKAMEQKESINVNELIVRASQSENSANCNAGIPCNTKSTMDMRYARTISTSSFRRSLPSDMSLSMFERNMCFRVIATPFRYYYTL